MQIWPILSRISISLSLTSLFLGLASKTLHAQASPTASKKAAISAFGTYSRISTDRDSHKNNGVTFGGNYTRYLNWFLTPSLEFRGKIAPGGTVGEKTFGGGIRGERRLKNFVPYANFLVSYGRLTFTHPDTSGPGKPYLYDDSIVYSTGLGLDYNLTSQWAARVDYQFEHWNLGQHNTFTPQVFSIGILYRIPFRPYQSY